MTNNTKVTVIPPTNRYSNKVGIYCRVSSKSEEQLNSLVNQVSFLTQIVSTKLGWHLVDIYLDIRSGSDAKSRIEFQRLLNDCRSGKVDLVFTKSISRFGRNTSEILSAINSLRECQVEVVFDQEEVSTNDPSSSLYLSIMEGVAQAENENRSKNVRWGLMKKAEEGTAKMFNRKCYGYVLDENGELKIDRERADIVIKIFEMYLQGKSIVGIISALENQQIPSPSGKVKWSKRSIELMLRNEKYSGDVIIFKTYNSDGLAKRRVSNKDGARDKYLSVSNHPAIISKETFEAVQSEIERRCNVVKSDDATKRKSTKYSSKAKNIT